MEYREVKLNSNEVFSGCTLFCHLFSINKINVNTDCNEYFDNAIKECKVNLDIINKKLKEHPIEHLSFDITFQWLYQLPVVVSILPLYKYFLLVDKYMVYLQRAKDMNIELYLNHQPINYELETKAVIKKINESIEFLTIQKKGG